MANKSRQAKVPVSIYDLLTNNNRFNKCAEILLAVKPAAGLIDKALEELSELSTKLLKYKNKGVSAVSADDIYEELVDVQMQLILITKLLGSELTVRSQHDHVVAKISKMAASKDLNTHKALYKRIAGRNNSVHVLVEQLATDDHSPVKVYKRTLKKVKQTAKAKKQSVKKAKK